MSENTILLIELCFYFFRDSVSEYRSDHDRVAEVARGAPTEKFGLGGKILSPNIRYFVVN